MITSDGWLNPTKAVGMIAYATAAICCGFAWIRAMQRRKDWRLAALLTVVEITLLLDVTFNWRWMLHQLLMDFAQRRHEYQLRREPQEIALGILAVLLLLCLFAVTRFMHGRDASLAVSGMLLSLVLWGTEVVSLHQVDHVLYHQLGQIMVVSLLWMLACMMTSIGMLLVSFHAQTVRRI